MTWSRFWGQPSVRTSVLAGSEEVEEIETTPGKEGSESAPQDARGELRRIRIDTVSGMVFSNIVAYFIMLTLPARSTARDQ